MSEAQGRFVWYELMTPDAGAATAFYRQVVGWGAQEAGQPGKPYTLLTAGGTPVAGLMPMPPEIQARGVPPHWIGYVGVSDVDAQAARVTAAGGRLHHGPEDIPGIGRFAVVADPQGAAFVLFTPHPGMPEPTPPAAPDAPGQVGWRELHAADGKAAFEFYAAMFGWTKSDALDMGPLGTYQLFATGGPNAVGGMMTRMQPEMPPAWLYYVNVESIEAAQSRVREGGGAVLHGPHQVPGGSWIINCRDPQGAYFALVAPKP